MTTHEKYNLLNSLTAVYKSQFKTEPPNPCLMQLRLSRFIIKLSTQVNREFKDSQYFRDGLTSITLKSKGRVG